MEEKYRFVKIKRNTETSGTWFFVPNSEKQLAEHFNKIIKGEIKQALDDYIRGSYKVKDKSKPEGYWTYHQHPITPWGRAVETIWHVYGGSWLEASLRLENELVSNRFSSIRKGKEIYLDNGVVETVLTKDDDVVEEYFSDELIYPVETQVRREEVRYMQWNMPDLAIKGTHWYAKIGNTDIQDEKGNMKWDTKQEAEKAAEWFVRRLNAKRYN